MSRYWDDDRNKLLIELFNKGLNYKEISRYFDEKTESSISHQCNRVGLKRRSVNIWTCKEIELLKNNFSYYHTVDLQKLFKNRTTKQIQSKANELGLKKSEEVLYMSKIDNINLGNSKRNLQQIGYEKKTNYNKNTIKNLNSAFNQYKEILNNNRKCFNNNNVNKYSLIILFKYYLKINNIKVNRDYLLSLNYGKFLEKSKLKNCVKNTYHSYYNFICSCYPKYGFKIWEFKILDCPNYYWDNKYNRYYYIREVVKYLRTNNIIDSYNDLFKMSAKNEKKYFIRSFTNNTKNCIKTNIKEYLDFMKIDYVADKYYDNFHFDSFEELDVYKILKYINKDIVKNSKIKFYNEEFNENYIPDFIIGNYIIEYFGLYDNNSSSKFIKKYILKTQRKEKYFNSLNNYEFIGIYPNELNNLNELKTKLSILKEVK